MQGQEFIDQSLAIDIIQNITNLIRATFPATLVFPSIGNHDYEPYDQLLPYENSGYTDLADMWNMAGWVDTQEAQATIKQGTPTTP